MASIKQFLIQLYIVVTVCLLLLAYNNSVLFVDLHTSCFFTVLFAFVTFLLLFFVQGLQIFSFPIIFLGVTFLFTTSCPVLFLLYGMKGLSEWRFIDLDGINRALVLVNMLYSTFYIGTALGKTKSSETLQELDFTKIIEKKNDPYQLRVLRNIGFVLLGFSAVSILIPTLQGKGLMTFIRYSYVEYHAERAEGSVDLFFKLAFSNFIPWSLILICLGSKNLKQFKRNTLLFALPFILVIFLTGDRSSAFPIILLLFSIFFIKFYKTIRVPWKKIIIVCIIAIYFIPILRVTRNIPVQDWTFGVLIDVITFQENTFHMEDSDDLNVITSTMYSVSHSLQTLVGTMKLVPAKTSYRYGFDYFIRPVIVAIPLYDLFIDLDFRTRRNSIWVQPTQWISYYYNKNGTGIGYLQLSEAYLNFGPLGVVLFYILAGFLLTRFWLNAIFFKNMSLRKLAFWLLFFNNVFGWIRNDATGQIRYLTWAWAIIYGTFFLIKIFSTRKYRKPIRLIPEN